MSIAPTRPRGRPLKYPWRTMEVGESFFAAGRTSTSICRDARLYHAPRRFSTKKVIVNGFVGVRVWRVA